MKKLSVMLLIAAHAVASADDRLATPATPANPAAQADRVFAKWSGAGTPGCAVAVAQGGQPVFKRAYGASDLERGTPNTPETVFEAGSVSKQFTAAAVLLLAKDGKLSLSDDVRKYLPELPDYGRRITLEHMLTHTSGLRDWGSVVELEGWPRGTRAVSMEQALAVIARQRALNFAPGERYSYTNSGYVLAAFVVQRVSGKTLAEFTRERLFVPLGMKHTQWRDNFRRVVPNRAVAYSRAEQAYEQDMPFEDVYGHGGLLTTVGDLLIWNEALTRNLLDGGIAQELERLPAMPAGVVSSYARGLMLMTRQGVAEVSHGGATAGYRTWLGRYPDRQLSVALLCNAGDVNADALARSVAQAWLAPSAPASAAASAAVAAAAVPAPVSLPAADSVAPYAGVFYSELNARKVALELRDGALAIKNGKVLRALDGNTFAVNTGTFAFSGPDQFVARYEDGGTVQFRRLVQTAPDRAALSAYEGSCRSDEVPATYQVSADGAKLVVRIAGNGATMPLSPLAPDAFDGAGHVVRFLRDAQGRVTGATVGTDRLFELRFDKLPR